MKWSWKIGSIAGIEVRVHATFLMLLAWIVSSAFFRTRNAWEAVGAALFAAAVFGTIVLHEFGHALMAKRFGVRTRDITLLPIGGMARLDKIPENPRQEFLIALAGPLVNVVLAIIFLLAVAMTEGLRGLSWFHFEHGHFLSRMLWLNVTLAAFNLLPAFPMDGGRVLRALLACKMNYARATQIAANIGKSMAIIFCAIGLFGNPILVLVGMFVWVGADAEAAMVQMKSILTQIPISRVMMKKFRALKPDELLLAVIDESFASGQQIFPVIADGKVVGILSHNQLFKSVEEKGTEGTVALVMERRFPQCDVSDSAEVALSAMTDGEYPAAVITENRKIAGIVTSEALLNYIRLNSAFLKFGKRQKRNVFAKPPASWAEEHAFAVRL